MPGIVPAFQACLEELAEDAIDIYKELEPSLAPDSRIPNWNSGDADLDGVQSDIGKQLAKAALQCYCGTLTQSICDSNKPLGDNGLKDGKESKETARNRGQNP